MASVAALRSSRVSLATARCRQAAHAPPMLAYLQEEAAALKAARDALTKGKKK